MKKIKYLLFFFIILLSSNVYASEFNMNNYTSATQDGTKNRYRATEIDYSGIAGTYQFNTRYTGRISMLETYFSYPFEANTTYTLTYNMATEDFRNNFSAYYWWDCDETMNSTNQHTGSFSYVSYKKVKFTFKPSENTTCIRVMLGSSNLSSKAITGISNWNLSSITLYDPDWQSGSGSGQGSTTAPTPSPNSNQDIINNQNNNTQDIINNNNQNTQDIIENNNQNSQNIIDNQNQLLGNLCPNLFQNFIRGAYSPSTGILDDTNPATYATEKISVEAGSKYVITGFSPNTAIRFLYWNNSNFISTNVVTATSSPIVVTTTGNLMAFQTSTSSSFSNIQVEKGEHPTSYCEYGSYSSKLDDTTNAINNVNDSINNSNVDNGVGEGFFDDFTSQDFGLSSIITIPLNTIQGLTSKSCVALNVPIPFTNSSVSLPCMTQVYEQNVPTIYNLWKIVSFGIIAYFISIDIFHMVKGFKDPESDKVEVLDL